MLKFGQRMEVRWAQFRWMEVTKVEVGMRKNRKGTRIDREKRRVRREENKKRCRCFR